MRTLDLDFQRRRPASAAGWALLAAGALAAVWVFHTGERVAAETAAFEDSVRRIERTLPGAARAPATTAENKAQEAVLADMRRVVAQLNLPWNGLFASLESIVTSDVALLSLTPDARKRQLRISAEARNLGAMLAFHRRLEETGRVRDVALVTHEIGEQAPERPVRFNIVATWVVDDARP